MKQGKIGKLRLQDLIFLFIIKPAASGLYGFASFFIILLFSKYFALLVGSISRFSVEIKDVELSFLGFFLFFLMNLLKNIQNYHSHNLHD